ncbi:PRC-barrel domain-containing protein [Microvirga sp. 2MCAF38]|uniref:PRC-barrel domain-containing protein n=1 Tax=Microvirga sp. 2MCAF38 TaxID=3232989 RepID=UPI003F9C9942
MLTHHLALAFFGAALISAPAIAQTTQPSAPTPSSGQMSTGNWMTQEQPGQWRVSKIEGLNVYNNNNEKIGDIRELFLDNSGKVAAIVVGVGGFLGMGEHDVAVPFDQITLVYEPLSNTTASSGTAVAPNPNAPASSGTVNTTGSVATVPSATSHASTPDHAKLNMTKDQLKAAPEFKYVR